MFKRTVFFIFLALFVLTSIEAGRAPVTFKVTPDATVADLLLSTHKRHEGLNLPRCPEFSPRKFWQTTPAKMDHYSAYFKLSFGTLPTATFIRFLNRTPELFEDSAIRKVYTISLAEFIAATKVARAHRTRDNIAILRQKEAVVISFLKRLDLQNPLIRAKAARLFSTQKQGFVSWLLNAPILPFRSYFQEKDCKKGKKLRVVPRFLILPLLVTAGAGSCLALGAGCLFDSDIPMWLVGAAVTYKTLKAFKNDTKLTPEPYGGIKVKIQLDEGETADASASQTGYSPDF